MVEPVLSTDWIVDRQHKERLVQALFVSVVLHILFLSIKLPQQPLRHLTGDSSLAVTFVAMNIVSPGPLADRGAGLPKNDERTLIQARTSDFVVRPKSSKPHAPLVEQESSHPEPAKTVTEAAQGAESRYVHKPGEARAVIEVRADGRIGQIIWDILPAITDEQLTQLETAIRARGHIGPGRDGFVRETIDVRDFLGEGFNR